MFVSRLSFQFQFSGDLFTFIEDILNWKIFTFCAVQRYYLEVQIQSSTQDFALVAGNMIIVTGIAVG